MTHSVPINDDDLLNRAIEAHYADIKAAVRRRGHSGSTASDIVHDLYIKLAEQPEILRGKQSLCAFLCRAAINLGLDRSRRQKLEQRLFSGTEVEALAVPADTAAPYLAIDVEARLRVLRGAIAELPMRRRIVFILHRLQGLEPDQIARRLNISRNMVDRHLRRALAHCLDCLHQLD